MLLSDLQVVQDVWPQLASIVCVPRTESDYRRLSVLQYDLRTLVGEGENHLLTSLIEVVEVLIEKYKLDQESTECEALHRLCLLMFAQAYVEEEPEDTVVKPKCLNPDYKER